MATERKRETEDHVEFKLKFSALAKIPHVQR